MHLWYLCSPGPNKAAQPIHCPCNKFIHPYRHTGKHNTQGDGRGKSGIDAEMEGYISPSRFVSLGVWVIRLSPQSLLLQIGLPPLPPAVCPVKSTHDVSLSQLWVEIHRINRFVSQPHAWEFSQTARLVHALLWPILSQQLEKQGNAPMNAWAYGDKYISRLYTSYRNVYKHTCIYVYIYAHYCLAVSWYLSVLHFISWTGQQKLDERLFPCNYCLVNRSEGESPVTAAAAFNSSHTDTHARTHTHIYWEDTNAHTGRGSGAFRVVLIGWAVTSPKPCHPCERSLQIDQ